MAQTETIVSGVSGRYASALFALAQEERATDQVAADLRKFAALVADSADLQSLVRSPVFTAEEQTAAVGAVLAKAGIGGLTANFLKLIASKRRLFAVSGMIDDFLKLHDAARGVARAQVTVANAMDDAQRRSLEETLKGITGGKAVDIDVKVDPAIIGGIAVKLGSRMFDGTLRTKLQSLRSRMKEVG